jgi:hypothetical protein
MNKTDVLAEIKTHKKFYIRVCIENKPDGQTYIRYLQISKIQFSGLIAFADPYGDLNVVVLDDKMMVMG